jgi:hypothetical protein
MRGGDNKLLLVRGHARTVAGHHRPENTDFRQIKIGGFVHHFKWYGDIESKIRARRDFLLIRGKPRCMQLSRFLRFWNLHGRLPIKGEFGFHFPKKPSNWPSFKVPSSPNVRT